jgi:ActR/RegA family two-component response regulator
VALNREHLERHGVKLVERLESESFTFGNHTALARVVQQLVAYAAEGAAPQAGRFIWVRVWNDGDSVVLEVQNEAARAATQALSELLKPLSHAHQSGSVALKLATEVVVAHGGHLEVGEREGGGASLRVVLPAASPFRASSPPSRGFASATAERRRILIVDSAPLFSRALRRGLLPHEVRIASTASEAELLLADPAYAPDLVVCDVVLPGASGDVLHARVRAARPELAERFVFVTGGALGTTEAEYLRLCGCATRLKPFDVDGLRELVASDEPASTSVRTLAPPAPAREDGPPNSG